MFSQGQYCDICSKGDGDHAHPITNAIDGTERWWQSPPLSRSTEYNEVNVTLDLGQVGLGFKVGLELGYGQGSIEMVKVRGWESHYGDESPHKDGRKFVVSMEQVQTHTQSVFC